jgi:hypothetical protein
MRIAIVALASLAVACGGSDSTGSSDANVLGTWVFTFTTNNSCSLTQIAVIIFESTSGAPTGNHGTYVFDCAGTSNDEVGVAGSITGWQVSGNDFSLQFTNTPPRRLTGTVDGNTMTGTFVWEPNGVTYGGSYTAVRQ